MRRREGEGEEREIGKEEEVEEEGTEEEELFAVTEGYRLTIVEVLDELERREICDLIHDVHTHFLAPIQHEVFPSLILGHSIL